MCVVWDCKQAVCAVVQFLQTDETGWQPTSVLCDPCWVWIPMLEFHLAAQFCRCADLKVQSSVNCTLHLQILSDGPVPYVCCPVSGSGGKRENRVFQGTASAGSVLASEILLCAYKLRVPVFIRDFVVVLRSKYLPHRVKFVRCQYAWGLRPLLHNHAAECAVFVVVQDHHGIGIMPDIQF